MAKDIEPILRVLSNYQQQLVLSNDERTLLESWLRASEANQDLFDDLSNEEKWENAWPAGIARDPAGSMERIRRRLIENLENE